MLWYSLARSKNIILPLYDISLIENLTVLYTFPTFWWVLPFYHAKDQLYLYPMKIYKIWYTLGHSYSLRKRWHKEKLHKWWNKMWMVGCWVTLMTVAGLGRVSVSSSPFLQLLSSIRGWHFGPPVLRRCGRQLRELRCFCQGGSLPWKAAIRGSRLEENKKFINTRGPNQRVSNLLFSVSSYTLIRFQCQTIRKGKFGGKLVSLEKIAIIAPFVT